MRAFTLGVFFIAPMMIGVIALAGSHKPEEEACERIEHECYSAGYVQTGSHGNDSAPEDCFCPIVCYGVGSVSLEGKTASPSGSDVAACKTIKAKMCAAPHPRCSKLEGK